MGEWEIVKLDAAELAQAVSTEIPESYIQGVQDVSINISGTWDAYNDTVWTCPPSIAMPVVPSLSWAEVMDMLQKYGAALKQLAPLDEDEDEPKADPTPKPRRGIALGGL